MNSKATFRDSALRAVAIIGLIAILILGAWGIIQLVVGLSGFFGGSTTTTSQAPSEQVVVTAPGSITSDQPFTLSWTHTGGTGNYSYTISYACETGLTIAAPMPTGDMRIVPCDVPFNFTGATGTIQLTPVFHTTTNGTTIFTVAATRLSDGKVSVSGTTAPVTVVPTPQSGTATAGQAPTPTPAPTKTVTKPAASYTASGHTTNLYGYADLAVRIISVTPVNGRYTTQFEISNIGTNVAPAGWDFYAELPLNPTYQYVSPSQQKLYPGDKIVYTLGFTAPTSYTQAPSTSYINPYTTSVSNCGYNQTYTYNGYANYPTGTTYNCNTPSNYAYPTFSYTTSTQSGTSVFSVTADPQSLIPELNKENNSASATITY